MNYALLAVGALIYFTTQDQVAQVVEDALTASSDSFTKYDPLFQKYGDANGVAWWMLKAIAMNESNLGQAQSVATGIADPSNVEESKSFDGLSWGIMQMTVTTLRDFDRTGSAEKLNDPEYSIKYAAKFVRYLQNQFPLVDPRWEEWVIKSYNQGVGNTHKEQSGVKLPRAQDVQNYWQRYQRNRDLIRRKQGV